MIEELLFKSQHGDKNAILFLINKFNPLLKKYAYKLKYDDAYNDLLVDFINVIKSINIGNMRNRNEGTYVSYLHESIYRCYTKKLSYLYEQFQMVSYSSLSKEEQYIIDAKASTNDRYIYYNISDIKKILSEEEFSIIYSIYMEGMSVSEIARQKNISRQAINQKKIKALKKLKKKGNLFAI